MKFDTVFIDGDLLLYSVGFATQRSIYHVYCDGTLAWIGTDKREINRIFKDVDYSYELWVYSQPPYTAVETYKTILKNYAKKFQTQDVRVILSGDTNFRTDVATTREYKGTRNSNKPENYYPLKTYMIENGAIMTDNEEADDYISYMTYNNYKTVAVTQDKDALNTPSYIFRPNSGKKGELVHVNEEDAAKNFWGQVITGDSVDNIPGLPGFGKAACQRILDGCNTYSECERAVGLAYACHAEVEDPEEYLREQATLLWMRRYPGQMWRIGMYD